MAFDGTLPATGVTAFGILYGKLRDNFVDLEARIAALKAVPTWVELVPASPFSVGISCYYGIDGLGDVVLIGSVYANNRTLTLNQEITIYDRLREGYRPTTERNFPANLNEAGGGSAQEGHGTLRVLASGVMTFKSYLVTGQYDLGVYFSIVRFRAGT